MQDSLHAGSWKLDWMVGTEIEHKDNVFRLSPGQQQLMELNDSSVAVSGRFRDMREVADNILSAGMEFEARSSNAFMGADLSLKLQAQYHHFLVNKKKSHAEFDLSVTYDVSPKGKIKLEAYLIPSVFIKNYLADATDSTGSVSAAERVYQEGKYHERQFALSYKHDFDGVFKGFESYFQLGYGEKLYSDPFRGRNEHTLSVEAGVEVKITKRWSTNLSYLFLSTRSPVSNEVLILDEQDYRIDFNNDRDFADDNLRTVQSVDRSDGAQVVEFSATVKPSNRMTLEGEVEFTARRYFSTQPIDPVHRDRHDDRTTIRVGLSYQIVPHVHLEAIYRYAAQSTDRRSDPENLGETTDYVIRSMRLGLSWKVL